MNFKIEYVLIGLLIGFVSFIGLVVYSVWADADRISTTYGDGEVYTICNSFKPAKNWETQEMSCTKYKNGQPI